MRKKSYIIPGILCGALLFYLIANGCVWVTYTADSQLQGTVALKSSHLVKTVYFHWLPPSGEKSVSYQLFQQMLESKFAEAGVTRVDAPELADLRITLKTRIYNKTRGSVGLFLFVIPLWDLTPLDGMRVDVDFRTDLGHRQKKRYVVYTEKYYYGAIGKSRVERAGLEWDDVFEKLTKNGLADGRAWEKRRDIPMGVHVTVDAGREKDRIAKIFGDDFAKIFPILQEPYHYSIISKQIMEDLQNMIIVESEDPDGKESLSEKTR